MIKDVIKKIILFIISIYFILSLIYTGYAVRENINYYSQLEFSNSDKTHVESISLPDGETYLTLSKGHVYTGRSIIINNNIQVIIASVLLGTFLGLVISAKKSKVIQYMVFYIIGNLLFNSIFSILYYFKFNYFTRGIFDIYIDVFLGFIMFYTVSFFLILSLKNLITKLKNK